MPNNSSNDSSPLVPKNSHRFSATSHQAKILLPAGAIIVLVVITIISIISVTHSKKSSDSNSPSDKTIESEISEPTSSAPEYIDLQPVIDEWINSLDNSQIEVGLVIFDLDNHQIAASYQPDKVFNIASIYKLFYVYSGYQLIDSDIINEDEYFVTTSDYRAGNYTFSECLDLAIRESYNGCADPMRADNTLSQYAETFITELELNNTTDLGLYSTASDLTKLLIHVWQHSDLSDQSWQKLSDSMLYQPPTTIDSETVYNWRQGLPSGFSDQVSIYDKVGWAWDGEKWSVYADVSILEFSTKNRHYTAAILTIDLSDTAVLTTLSEKIESAISTS